MIKRDLRRTAALGIAIAFLTTFLVFPNSVQANMGLAPPYWKAALALWMLLLSASVEAIGIGLVLRRRFAGVRHLLTAVLLVFLLNLVTVLITNVIGITIESDTDVRYTFYIAEIFPLVVEYLVLSKLFSRMYNRGGMVRPVSKPFMFLLVLGMNALTVALGLLIFS